MIIDIHGHYTTEPQALHTFRDKQLAGLAEASRSPKDTNLGLTDEHVLRYDDVRRGQSRRARIAGDTLQSVRLSGDENTIASGEWLREWLARGESVASIRRMLLSPSTTAPAPLAA